MVLRALGARGGVTRRLDVISHRSPEEAVDLFLGQAMYSTARTCIKLYSTRILLVCTLKMGTGRGHLSIDDLRYPVFNASSSHTLNRLRIDGVTLYRMRAVPFASYQVFVRRFIETMNLGRFSSLQRTPVEPITLP